MDHSRSSESLLISRIFAAAVVLLTAWSLTGSVPTVSADSLTDPILTLLDTGVDCGEPCVIESSPGGDVMGFRLQGLRLKARGTPVIVDGECASACTLLIDVDRANVCLTTRAVLEYHQGHYFDHDGKDVFIPLHFETPGLQQYFESRGGLPASRDDVLVVPFSEAKQFYKPCAGAS